MFKVVEVTPLPNYRLRLRYEDGVVGDVGLGHLVGQGVFALWNDLHAFESVSIGESGEPRWSDEVDLCPDTLYMEITRKTPEELFPNLAKAHLNA